MKYIIPILLFISCKPSKSDIVEAQKAARDSIQYYQNSELSEELKIEYAIKDSMNFENDIENRPTIRRHIESGISNSRVMGKIADIRKKKWHHEVVYDSLEFELKKY